MRTIKQHASKVVEALLNEGVSQDQKFTVSFTMTAAEIARELSEHSELAGGEVNESVILKKLTPDLCQEYVNCRLEPGMASGKFDDSDSMANAMSDAASADALHILSKMGLW